MVEKTLIFHFYSPKEYKDNIAIRMHLECLRMYSRIFNHAIFVIAKTDDNCILIPQIEKDILDCGFTGDVRFVVKENDIYGEARTFKEFVYDRLDKYDGLVFFAHTKGVTNVYKYPEFVSNTLHWIYALYFYSLEFIPEVEAKMIGGAFGYFRTFFGPLLMRWSNDRYSAAKDEAHYPGTFYWLNPGQFYGDIQNKIATPPIFHDRFFAEQITMAYRFEGRADRLDSRMSIWGKHMDLYHCNFDDVISYYGDYDLYMERYNEIIKKIGYEG